MRAGVNDLFYVGAQFGCFVAFIFDIHAWKIFFSKYLFFPALLLIICGAGIILIGLMQLRKQISPFPSPLSHSKLIVSGIYKHIRHPIYAGILSVFLGFSILADSGYKLVVTCLLLLIFYGKTEYEEKKLMEKFSEYLQYKNHTGRFFPKFF